MKLLKDQRTRRYKFEDELYHTSRELNFVFNSEKGRWYLASDGCNYGVKVLREVLEKLNELNKEYSK